MKQWNRCAALMSAAVLFVACLLTGCVPSINKPSNADDAPTTTTVTHPADVSQWEKVDYTACTAHVDHKDEVNEDGDIVLYMPERIEIEGGYRGPFIIEKYNDTTLLIGYDGYRRKIPLYQDEIKELNDQYRLCTDFSCQPENEYYFDTGFYHEGHVHALDSLVPWHEALEHYMGLLLSYYDGTEYPWELPDDTSWGDDDENLFDFLVVMPDKIVVRDYPKGRSLTIIALNDVSSIINYCEDTGDSSNWILLKDEGEAVNRLYGAITDFTGEVKEGEPLVEIHREGEVTTFSLGYAHQKELNDYMEMLLDRWYYQPERYQ